jgi:predicted alpha/beta-fold hydrolase
MTSFVAAPWLANRHLMTIYGSIMRWPIRLPIERQRWELPDGDFVDVDRLPGALPHSPQVIVLHGLEGSSRAGYVRGLLAELHLRGFGAIAVNFRGCSGVDNRLPRLYHSGDTGDLSHVVDRLVSEAPGRLLALAGFSLGGNVVAKYLGERGDAVPSEVVSAVVISVPFDLAGCAAALDGPGLFSLLYRERFLRRLRAKALRKAARFPGLVDDRAIRRARSFSEFDEVATAPLHGFANARDYWTRSSSGPLLRHLRRPLLAIAAADDPFVPPSALPYDIERVNPLVTLEVTQAGGHVAFVEGLPWKMRRYAERRAAEFLAAALSVRW